MCSKLGEVIEREHFPGGGPARGSVAGWMRLQRGGGAAHGRLERAQAPVVVALRAQQRTARATHGYVVSICLLLLCQTHS